ncbi:BCCT family transporter [Pseudoclavibacter chungangensis]|uniref:BCCT family transporter n=1 Tax=Pseudoclavibacter chungangensis TaxID=587635 RepID=A0A7J5C2K0_9MICO|nr:choline BCCT transporter BetT [Pseudoclavibacter chungangensis]KAB1660273.1 BCCT family transporter [Pseudoclavibacter chungangensis]NYJ65619.1 choline/glycine/proline betaine transport protein [Pseudoclavibacter chungangensis]
MNRNDDRATPDPDRPDANDTAAAPDAAGTGTNRDLHTGDDAGTADTRRTGASGDEGASTRTAPDRSADGRTNPPVATVGTAESGAEAGAPDADAAPTDPVTRWPVFIGSSVLILAVAVWAMIDPDQAGELIGAVVVWTSANLGWYYILTAAVVVGFVLFLAFSRHGGVKLGPDHSKPQFSLFTWTSMLFAAGIGIDLMFFSVAEPVSQYYEPPTGGGESIEAARQAIVWTLFHYGPVGWAMYALMGGAFAYFAYRRNQPLSIRSLLTPLFGKRLDGWIGHTVDVTAVLGTVFGIATSLGIGVVQLNYGLYLMFGIPEGVGAQIGLIVLAVIMATISTVSGVEKGIRRLSELNVVLAIVLLVYITVTGESRRLMDGLVMNIGDFVARFPGMLMDTHAWEQPDEWSSAWTLFFWAWWIAWAPFVGLFLARISRGRTLRQFIAGVLVVPFLFIAVFISIFGNSALVLVLGGDAAFGASAMDTPERAFYDLLMQYPAAPLVVGLATITGLLFYVTSADSGALVLANLTSRIDDPKQDGAKGLRIFWSVATGLLTLAMLVVGGIPTLQGATLIIGLPFSIVMYLVMIAFFRALRTEAAHVAGYRATLGTRAVAGGQSWRRRLRRSTTFPQAAQVRRYIDATAAPALGDVADELRRSGVGVDLDECAVEGTDIPSLVLTVHFPQEEDFSYQIYPVGHERPSFTYRHPGESARYYRLEVFAPTGSRGYDVYGYSADQLIADVLGHYESHLEYLRLSTAGADASVGDEENVVTDWHDDFGDADEAR